MQLSTIDYNINNKNLNFKCAKQKLVTKVKQKQNSNIEIIKEDVAEYINAGFSYKDLAEFYHCGIETILEKLRDFGLIKENEKNNKGQIINITKDELQELVLKGLKIKDMAQKFNCSEHAIRDRLNKFELMDKYKEINNINTDINISKDELQEFVLKGLKIKDMAQKFNCSESAIRDRLNKFGLMDEYKKINNINISKDELQEFVLKGLKIKDIAKQFNCGNKAINRRLHEFGLMDEYKKVHNINTDINISKEELQELVTKGLKIKDMAQKFNCSEHAINNRLNKFGLMDEYKEINNFNRNTDINISKEELQELVIKGLNIKEIAQKFNCSRDPIVRRLHEFGLMDEYKEINNINIKEELQELVRKNFKIKEIAQKFNCSRQAIVKRLHKFGLMDEYKEINNINISKEELQKFVQKGVNIKEIAQKFNCSKDTISNRLHEFGLIDEYKEIHNINTNINISKEELQELVRKNFKIREIAQKFNCSRQAIEKRLHEFGLMDEYKNIQKTKELKNQKPTTSHTDTNIQTSKNEIKDKLQDLLLEGFSIKEIALKLNYDINKTLKLLYKFKLMNKYKNIHKTKELKNQKPTTSHADTNIQTPKNEISKAVVNEVIENKPSQIINDRIQILNKQFKRDVDLLKQKGIGIYTLAEIFELPILLTSPLRSLNKAKNTVKNTNNDKKNTEEAKKTEIIIRSPQKMSLTPEAINTRKKENKIYSKILEQRGIIVTENKYGQLTISEYMQTPKGAFEKNEVSENELLKNVIEITGNADFEKSDITELLYIENIGGNVTLWKSQIQSLGNLQTVGGNLELYGSKLEDMGLLTSIVGDLSFRNSNITDISSIKEIGGTVYLKNSKLKPQDFGHIKVKIFM